MKEYLKMSDYFDSGDVLVDGSRLHDGSGTVAKVFGPTEYSQYVAHAINSHDGLVAEVERLASECNQLTEQLFEADKMVQEMQQIIDGGAA